MRITSLALRGVALVAAAGAIIAATPAVAQNYGASSMMQSTGTMGSQGLPPASEVVNPSTTLASAKVEDASGITVGQVRSVSTSPSGKASAINVSLTTSARAGKVVSIGATRLHFNSGSNTLKASLTLSEINSLPAMQSP